MIRINRQRLDELVGRAGLSNADLAKLTGMSPTTLSHARNGRRVRPSTWRRIAKALSELPAMSEAIVAVAQSDQEDGRDRVGTVTTGKEANGESVRTTK